MPKTIAILAPSSVPFQVGGAEKLWWGLRQALAATPDWAAELIKIPVRENNFAEIVAAYKTFSELDLNHFDVLVSTKYPAWIAPHHCHVCYMQHPLRGLYDTYKYTGLPELLESVPGGLRDFVELLRKERPLRGDLPLFFELCDRALNSKSLSGDLFAFPGPLIRETVHFLDKVSLDPGQIRAYLAISGTVAMRKDYFPPNVPITILPHPSDLTGFKCRKGKYFFTASRLNASKRVDLIVDAMAHMPLDIPLKIAGTGPELENLKARAAHDRRIEFLGFVSDRDMIDLYADALAVPFCPLNEDYGLITIEAMHSGKPVITTNDSGGVWEFTRHNITGLIAEPTPKAIGEAMTLLGQNPKLAREMGERAKVGIEAYSDWEETAKTIIGTAVGGADESVLVAAPFPADAHGPGGPRRLFHFCATLAARHKVNLICYGDKKLKEPQTTRPTANFSMTMLPWPGFALKDAGRLSVETGASSDDLALMLACGTDERLAAELETQGKNAFCVVLSHPWLFDAVRGALPEKPLIYDAHNVETEVRAALKDRSDIYQRIEDCERNACQAAKVVIACCSNVQERLPSLYDCANVLLAASGCDVPAAMPPKKELRQRLAYPDATLALFIGSGHQPNVEAAFAIMDIARQIPEVEFLLAGSVSTQKDVRRATKPDNVHLLGPVSEKVKNALLASADLALNPVTSGSGINLKIIEYLAAGLPCVTTPFGMRGLPAGLEPVASICNLEDFPVKIREFLSRPPSVDAIKSVSLRISSEFAWDATLAPILCAVAALRERQCSS